MADVEFRRDLYRGTAQDYERFRVPYPQALIGDLAECSGASGGGRLLDLACGTGQLTLPLHRCFAEVWAVDQEPGMVDAVREKADASRIGNIRALVSAAEDLSAPEGSFDLVVIGNAFHRLRRDIVASKTLRWLRPGGLLALVWGGTPWYGQEPWQRAITAAIQRWTARAVAGASAPPAWSRYRPVSSQSVSGYMWIKILSRGIVEIIPLHGLAEVRHGAVDGGAAHPRGDRARAGRRRPSPRGTAVCLQASGNRHHNAAAARPPAGVRRFRDRCRGGVDRRVRVRPLRAPRASASPGAGRSGHHRDRDQGEPGFEPAAKRRAGRPWQLDRAGTGFLAGRGPGVLARRSIRRSIRRSRIRPEPALGGSIEGSRGQPFVC